MLYIMLQVNVDVKSLFSVYFLAYVLFVIQYTAIQHVIT